MGGYSLLNFGAKLKRKLSPMMLLVKLRNNFTRHHLLTYSMHRAKSDLNTSHGRTFFHLSKISPRVFSKDISISPTFANRLPDISEQYNEDCRGGPRFLIIYQQISADLNPTRGGPYRELLTFSTFLLLHPVLIHSLL